MKYGFLDDDVSDNSKKSCIQIPADDTDWLIICIKMLHNTSNQIISV